jgi:hypothetical protein
MGLLCPPKEIWMNRPILAFTLFAVASAALGAQQASQSSPYQGTSNPPADDTIVTTTTPQAKPPAGRPMNAAPAVSRPDMAAPDGAASDAAGQGQPSSVDPAVNNPDAGPVSNQRVLPPPTQPTYADQPGQPVFAARVSEADPDGDIVHPAPLGPGQIGEGTNIRVRLLDRLSTTESEKGQPFRSQVASDVLQGGQVEIPAGTEIDGTLVEVSTGRVGGHGSMRLRPELMILPDGSRYQLRAQVTGTPGSKTRVGSEGTIVPGSRMRRDEIEYGGAVGAGLVTGAVLGGPVGAVTGGAIGAGVVTTHLLVSHPQATLEPGAILQFTLTETLNLTRATAPGN